jgi:hypothetical protein
LFICFEFFIGDNNLLYIYMDCQLETVNCNQRLITTYPYKYSNTSAFRSNFANSLIVDVLCEQRCVTQGRNVHCRVFLPYPQKFCLCRVVSTVNQTWLITTLSGGSTVVLTHDFLKNFESPKRTIYWGSLLLGEQASFASPPASNPGTKC